MFRTCVLIYKLNSIFIVVNIFPRDLWPNEYATRLNNSISFITYTERLIKFQQPRKTNRSPVRRLLSSDVFYRTMRKSRTAGRHCASSDGFPSTCTCRFGPVDVLSALTGFGGRVCDVYESTRQQQLSR